MSVQFVQPYVLFLLWIAPALAGAALAIRKRQRARLATFTSAAMQKKLAPQESERRFLWQLGLISVGLLLAIVAAARPQWGQREELVLHRGRDLVIALDVSRSMLATDVHPDRLRRAKADILDVISDLQGDRAALLAFRGKGSLLCPLTTDYSFFRLALDAADIDSAPIGETDIGDAINKALDAFDNENGAHKAIVLISDGEDLCGRALEAAQKAAERNVPIFTVGIGASTGARIPSADSSGLYMTHDGKDVVTRLDNDTLLAIARATHGAYIPIATAGVADTTLGTLYRSHLRRISAQDLEETKQHRYVERYQLFLLPALLFMLSALFLSKGRLSLLPRQPEFATAQRTQLPLKQMILAGMLFLPLPPLRAATNAPSAPSTNAVPHATREIPPGREGARYAQQLYSKGRYEEAAAAYLEAAGGSTARSQSDFRYNAAVAHYRAGNYKQASSILRDLTLTDRSAPANTAMLLGGSLYHSAGEITPEGATNLQEKVKLMHAAGEAFRGSTRIDSESERAQHNLAAVLQVLPELETQSKIAALTEKHGQTPPGELAATMLHEQRQLAKDIASAFTNTSPSQVAQLEDLAVRQSDNADVWIPLKGMLLQAMSQEQTTNTQQQLAGMEVFVERTRDSMLSAAERIRDLDPTGYEDAKGSEAAIYQLWKGVAPFSLLLEEDLRLQTNLIDMARDNASPTPEASAQQGEAAVLTRLFAQRFSQSVPEEGMRPQGMPPATTGASDTNQVEGGISAEDRETILQLAATAEAAQAEAAHALETNDATTASTKQKLSYRLLREIQDLLPKQKQSAQQQPREQDQNQKNQPQEQESPPQSEPDPEQQPQQEQEPPQEQEQQPQQNQDEMSDEEVLRLLEKAMQREKDHEKEVRKRKNAVGHIPVDRDW